MADRRETMVKRLAISSRRDSSMVGLASASVVSSEICLWHAKKTVRSSSRVSSIVILSFIVFM